MQTYAQFQPTVFDRRGVACDDRQDWLVVPVAHNRDSCCLDRSNFQVALGLLGGEGDTVEVHRFGHWACGWFDVLLVHPDREREVVAIGERLDNYPILDEDHFSETERVAAWEYWGNMGIKERVAWCQRFRVSVFSARHEAIPEGIDISDLAD